METITIDGLTGQKLAQSSAGIFESRMMTKILSKTDFGFVVILTIANASGQGPGYKILRVTQFKTLELAREFFKTL